MKNLLETYFQRKEDLQLKEEWGKKLSSEYAESTDLLRSSESTKKIHQINRKWILIAAGAIILIGSLSIYSQMTGQSNINPKYQIAQLQIITNQEYDHRGEVTKTKNYSMIAHEAMQENLFDEAIHNYQLAKKEDGLSALDKYHFALAYAKTGRDEKSIAILEKPKDYKAETNWLLALNYINANKLDEAKAMLESIIKDRAYKHKDAEKLYKQYFN